MHEHEPAVITPAGLASVIWKLRDLGFQAIGHATTARIVTARHAKYAMTVP
jgi:hypothetical protein